MKFSYVIPTYNAQNTIESCLDSIFLRKNKDFEVIVVNDKSSDKTLEIVNKYCCVVIDLQENKGAANARNVGAEKAQGDILIFLDSDVEVASNTLDIVEEGFNKHTDIVAMTGLLAKECPYKNFSSQYKNLYMNFVFQRCREYVEFLYGSIIVVRKEDFLPFSTGWDFTDDTELGLRYTQLGKKILLNHSLEVIHWKEYRFSSLIRNDYKVPFWWSKSFLVHKGYLDVLSKKRFAHAQNSQILSICIVYLIVLCLPLLIFPYTAAIISLLFLVFLSLNKHFFSFLYKEKGSIFLAKSIFMTIVDLFVMGLGIISGLCYFGTKMLFHGYRKDS